MANDKPAKPKKVKPENADGHRERLRSRFTDGPASIEDHHLLELLLFNTIPVRDTREQAVGLLKRFKSLRGIFEAGFDELCEVEGVGAKSALLIKEIYEVVCRVNTADKNPAERYSTVEAVGELMLGMLRYEKDETVCVAAFDNSRRLTDTRRFCQNQSGQITVGFREIVEFAIRSSASYIVIAHNHPGGDLLPSLDDVNFTEQLRNLLGVINVVLLEHILCADDDYYPIIRKKL